MEINSIGLADVIVDVVEMDLWGYSRHPLVFNLVDHSGVRVNVAT